MELLDRRATAIGSASFARLERRPALPGFGVDPAQGEVRRGVTGTGARTSVRSNIEWQENCVTSPNLGMLGELLRTEIRAPVALSRYAPLSSFEYCYSASTSNAGLC